MPEPKVGMKFGTYDEMVAQNKKTRPDYVKTDSMTRAISQDMQTGRPIEQMITEIWSDKNNPRNTVWGHKEFRDTGSKWDYYNTDLSVFSEGGILHYCSAAIVRRPYDEPMDFKFETIIGDTKRADDLNGNGIVDEGEISEL